MRALTMSFRTAWLTFSLLLVLAVLAYVVIAWASQGWETVVVGLCGVVGLAVVGGVTAWRAMRGISH